MIDEKLIEKFYSKLFTIPRKRITVSIGLATIILASLLNGTVSKTFFAQRYFFIGLSLIVCIFVAAFILKMAFNSRRIFFLALFILIFVEIFDFIAIHILNSFNLIIMSPAAMATGLMLILFFTSRSSELRTALVSTMVLIAIYPVNFLFSFETPHRFVAYSATILAGVIIAFGFIKYIDRNYDGINIKKLLRSFLLFWLTSQPEYFENELLKTSIRKKGWVKCLKIGDVLLFSTSFHPGPLRNVGGAKMVGEVLEKFESAMYLHSAAKHDSNPSSFKDVRSILNAVDGVEFVPVKAMKPVEVEGEKFSVRILPFASSNPASGVKLILISGKKAIDDIPEGIGSYAERLFGECMVVDCHNCHSENYEIDKADLEEIVDLLHRIREKLQRSEPVELRYSFFKKRIETANICGFVAMLLLDYGDDRHCLLMLDGNNVDCIFKNDLETFLAGKGVKATILSTDNHAKTAISPKVGYMPVGSDRKEREIVFDFIEECFEGLNFEGAVEIGYTSREVEINVMGDGFFKTVEKAFREIGEKAMYLFFTTILAQLVVAIVLGTLIM